MGMMLRREVLAGLVGSWAVSQTRRRPPNIVLILADDLGYGDLASYGSKINSTPNLDALAARGVRFTDFHSSGAVCSPTRAGLLTGRYQQRCGIPDVLLAAGPRDRGLDASEMTFSRLLKSAGYTTAVFGKWHLGYDRRFYPDKHGFDESRGFSSGNVDYVSHVDQTGRPDWWHNTKLAPEEGYATELITSHSVRFIEDNRLRPFCLYIAHAAVHYPYQAPGEAPERVAGKAPGRRRPPSQEVYRNMLTSMDNGVGKVMDALRRTGVERDTLVLFLSDNGATAAGSNGELRGTKATLWEGGHRVPAIACWPQHIPAGRTSEAVAISLDIMPTLLAAAGLSPPRGRRLDGVNLLPHLAFNRPVEERTLFWAHGKQRAVRKGRWKLVKLPESAAKLFDLTSDSGESNDLAAMQPEMVASMLSRLAQWEKEVGA
jgi:arylsulfatase A-like enzyme